MYTLGQSFVPGDISYPTGGHWYDPLIQAGAQILQKITQPKYPTYPTGTTPTTTGTTLGIDTTTLLLIGGAVLLVVLSSRSRRRS